MRPLGFTITFSTLLTTILAFPGMDQLVHQAGRHRRQADDANDTETCGGGGGPNTSEPGEGDFDSIELIGDLQTLSDADLSPVGRSVKNIILGQDCPESDITWDSEVPALGTAACQKDVCCIWQYIADDMMSVFRGRSGRCTGLARAAVRLGFHDAGGFSKATGPGGGADGSIILAPSEMQRSENNGLQDIVAHMQSWYTKWTADPSYYHYQYPTTTTTTSNEANERITMADLIQFGAHLAVVACPLGPRIRTFLGRADNASAAPEGLLPPVDGSAAFLIDLFRNKTIAPHGLAALVGAHTTSQQFFVDEARAGDPQDSTPGIWDVLFYQQTTLNAVTTTTQQVPPRVFMFDSDVALARDSSTGPEMALFAANGGQVDWNEDYAREYIRLSMLSVYQINNMVECTKVLPPAITNFTEPDQDYVNIWRVTNAGFPDVASELFNGSLVSVKDFQNVSSTDEQI